MKIIIRWNEITDNETGHRTTKIDSDKGKTSAELIIGWLTAHDRKPKDMIIHDINVDGFAQKIAGKNSGKAMTAEQRSDRARKAVEARKKKLGW